LWSASMPSQPDPTEPDDNASASEAETGAPLPESDAEPEPEQPGGTGRRGGRRWWIAAVAVPLAVAMIGAAATPVISAWLAAPQPSTTPDQSSPVATPDATAATGEDWSG